MIIRNLEDEIVVDLKRKAALAGKSLEQFMRDLCKREASSELSGYFKTRDLLMAKVKSKPKIDPAETIRRMRDERGRYIHELVVLGEATFDPDS